MSNLKISQLPITKTCETTDVIPIVNDNTTKQINKNDFLINLSTFSGNTDTLQGATMRTIYSRSNVITYSVGTDTDLFGGDSNFGSRNFPKSFFSNSTNYNNKTIHFRITGLWASGGSTDTTLTIILKVGDDTLTSTTETLGQSRDKPSEIYGEILITNGNAIVCYAVGWCDQTGDYRKTALSNPTTSVDVTEFDGGNFQLIIGGETTRNFTSYLGYIQVWN